MAAGNTSVQVVENPTATNIKTAVDAIITALAVTTYISIGQLGVGKAIAIVGVEYV
ncbi:hypothetical protein LCGC14_2436820 [marine sediment metagenome]|uniref:Uncharacterized protein n=1 Tax=marine sediment metagenome TaxID=412755 RepID=A0A0F9EE92_9ZZZZ